MSVKICSMSIVELLCRTNPARFQDTLTGPGVIGRPQVVSELSKGISGGAIELRLLSQSQFSPPRHDAASIGWAHREPLLLEPLFVRHDKASVRAAAGTVLPQSLGRAVPIREHHRSEVEADKLANCPQD